MADYRSGNRDRDRGSSIFSDDDDDGRRRGNRGEWRSEDHGWGSSSAASRGDDRGRGGRSDWQGGGGRGEQDDRGFFSRAGDEVRSWFGDEEAERRREADARRYEQEHGENGRYRGGGHEDQWTGGSPSRDQDRQYSRSQMRPGSGGYSQDDSAQSGQNQGRGQGGHGQGGRSGGPDQSGQSRGGFHHDETYRQWRERQIEALDREYEEYCRHRQEQFENEFSSFRQTRQSGTASGGPGLTQGGQTGSTETASSTGATGGMGAQTGGQNAGETTTGGGNASAATSSTGSSGPAESASGVETGGGRSSRSR
jgi:hypothetical protein